MDQIIIIIIIEVYYLNNKSEQAKFVGDKILFFFSCHDYLDQILDGGRRRER